MENTSHPLNPTNKVAILSLLSDLNDPTCQAPFGEIVEQVRTLDRQATFNILIELLNDSNSNLKFRAGEMLLYLDAHVSQEKVMSLLKDSDANIRASIAELFCQFGDQRAVGTLTELLLSDSDSDVRANAAMALGCIGDKRAISALEWAMQYDKGVDFQGEPIRNSAKWAIKQITDPPRIPDDVG